MILVTKDFWITHLKSIINKQEGWGQIDPTDKWLHQINPKAIDHRKYLKINKPYPDKIMFDK